MVEFRQLITQSIDYFARAIVLLVIASLIAGCAVFGAEKPKPVPTGEVRFYIQQGDEHLQQDDYDKATESYTAAIGLDSKNIDARRKLAETHAAYGKTELALAEFARIIEIEPSYLHAYNYRGFIYYKQKKWAEAAKEFEAAVKVEPNSLYSLNFLGLTYTEMQKLEEAKTVLQKAVDLDPEMDDPDSKDTHNYLGRIYRDEGKYEEAIAELHKVLEHFPNDTSAHNYLGTVYENLGQYQDAVREYLETLRIDPEEEFATSKLLELQRAGLLAPPPVDIVKDDVEYYISTAPDASEYPGAGAIVLLDKLSYEFTSTGSARYTVHQIVKICNERGIAEFGEMLTPFNVRSQNIGVNVAKAILPDGTAVEAPEEAFHDITPPGLSEYNLYSDLMYKVVSMPALQPGVILEYKVTVEDAQASTEVSWILGSMAFQWAEPVLNAKCVLRVPKDVEIRWRLYNSQIEPVIMEGDGESLTYTWISKDNPAIHPEIAMPPLGEVVPLLMFSTAESWDDVYNWYKELADPQEQADNAIRRKVAELIVGTSTKAEKAKAIFEFVASDIRYVAIELGLGAYRPYPAIDVFKYRYGDCKDKVTLLVTMLREAGIDGYPVLISPSPHRKVDMEIPSIGQFSHVIAAIQIEEGSYVWLDPTVATCSYGDLPAGDQGRKAFVIGEDKGVFVDTPIYPSAANKIYSDSEIAIMADGSISGWERTIARGQADMYLRSLYKLVKPDRLKEFLQTILNQRYPGIQIKDVSISDLHDLDIPIEVKVDFSCPNYGSNQGEMLIFPLPSENFSTYASFVSTVERQYDLHLGYNLAVEKVLTLSFPKGYRNASAPEARSIKHELGMFVKKYEEIDDSTVRYSVSLKTDAPVIPASGYAKFKEFIETAAREDRAQIILTKSKSAIGL